MDLRGRVTARWCSPLAIEMIPPRRRLNPLGRVAPEARLGPTDRAIARVIGMMSLMARQRMGEAWPHAWQARDTPCSLPIAQR